MSSRRYGDRSKGSAIMRRRYAKPAHQPGTRDENEGLVIDTLRATDFDHQHLHALLVEKRQRVIGN